MGLLPNVHMNLVHPAGEVRREKSLVGQVWGPNAIASNVLGGTILNEGGRSYVRVARQGPPLLNDALRDRPSCHPDLVHSARGYALFPFVVTALQTYLERKRAY
jgi:hypothetical protein